MEVYFLQATLFGREEDSDERKPTTLAMIVVFGPNTSQGLWARCSNTIHRKPGFLSALLNIGLRFANVVLFQKGAVLLFNRILYKINQRVQVSIATAAKNIVTAAGDYE